MMPRHALPFLAVALAGAATPGRAAPATAEEAGRLAAVLQTYAGAPAPGATPTVTVTPQGEGYRAAIDVTRLAAPLHALDVDLVATDPLVLTLTPLLDGTWRVARGSFPRFGFTTRKGFTYSVQFDGTAADGIFDPRISAFTHQETTSGSTTGSITDGSYAQHSQFVQHGRQTVDAHGPDAGDVSSTLHELDSDLSYHSHGAAVGRAGAAPVRPDLDVAMTARALTTDVATTHENVASLLAVVAFLAAHPSRAQLVADQPRLRELLLAMLPYAASFAVGSELKGVTLDVNGGKASLDVLSQHAALGTDEAKDALAVSLNFAGLKIAGGQLPPWVGLLLPQDLTLDLQTSPLDVTAALRVLVQRTDLAADRAVPPDAVADALSKLARGGAISLHVKPSALANAALQVAATGSYDGAAATMALQVEAAGLDREVDMLVGADDPMAGQAAQVLSVARTLGKQLPDGRLAWDIRASAAAITVNGVPLR